MFTAPMFVVAAWLAGCLIGATAFAADTRAPKLPTKGAAAVAPTVSKFDATFRFRGSQARNLHTLQAGQEDLLRGVFQRIRAGVSYVRGPLDAYVQMQTAGAMGAAVKFDPDTASGALPVPVGLQQGWIRWRPPSVPGLALQAGRMPLSYGSERRIGRYDFHESGNAFDGLRIAYQPVNVLTIDLLAVKLQRNTAQPEQERNLLGGYVVARPSQVLSTDIYFLYLSDGDKELRANHMNMGLRLLFRPLYFLEIDAEAAVQFGDLTPQGYEKPIDHLATSYAAEVRTSGTVGIPMGLVLRLQRHSGDPDPTDDSSEAWRPLYPSLARQIGLLQLFPQSNLVQYGGGLRLGPKKATHLLVDARFCSAMSDSVVPAFSQPKLSYDDTWAPLGTELDVQVHVPFLDFGRLLLVTAFFVPSQLLADEVGKAWAQQFLVQVSADF